MSLPKWIQIDYPSVDRPFGIHLWPIFERTFEPIMGYKPQDFRYVVGKTPMSTATETFSTLLVYYIIIFGGRELMRHQPAMKLNGLFKIHNFYLTAISFSLLVLFLEQLIPTVWRHGLLYAICSHGGGWTDELVILYYLNYLTKYVELLDTVFLFLKKKPLTFLHTYHHGATALLCYTQLKGNTAVSWVPIVLNLTVHVVMYWYYFQSARGIKIWWKRYITILQILQFIIDLGFIYFATYTYFAFTYAPSLPNVGTCAGEEVAAFAGVAILSSYLLLFISFYAATYKKPMPKRRSRAASALKEMSIEKVPTVSEARRRLSIDKPFAFSSGASIDGHVTRSRKA